MRMFHFSDSHAGAPAEDWKAFLDKRWVGIFNYYFRRRFQHNQETLRKAVSIMLKRSADFYICTGDITSTGQPSEFKKAIDILSPLAETKKLIYLPGNHDFYVIDNKCNRALFDAFRYLNANKFNLSDLPLKLTFDDIELIIVNESYPSNLISSCGFLKKNDSKKIISMLENKSKPIIIVGHYPIIEKKPLLRIRHRLWGQNDILKKFYNGLIDVSLCGHVHKPYYIATGKNGRGEYCTGSVTKTSSFSELIYDNKQDNFIYSRINIEEE